MFGKSSNAVSSVHVSSQSRKRRNEIVKSMLIKMRNAHTITVAKRASDVMTQTRLRRTNWNGGCF